MSATSSDPDACSDREGLVKIMRRHVHDVRNHFGGIDLEAILISELAEDPEIAGSVARIRRHLEHLEGCVRSLLMMAEEPRPVAVTAGDLLQLWQMRLGKEEALSQAIEWPAVVPPVSLTVDVRAVLHVLCQSLLAAWQRSDGISPRITLESGEGILEVGLVEGPHDKSLPPRLREEAEALLGRLGAGFRHVQDAGTGQWRTILTLKAD